MARSSSPCRIANRNGDDAHRASNAAACLAVRVLLTFESHRLSESTTKHCVPFSGTAPGGGLAASFEARNRELPVRRLLSRPEPPSCDTCKRCIPRVTAHGRTYFNLCLGGAYGSCDADRRDVWAIAVIFGTCGVTGRHWEPIGPQEARAAKRADNRAEPADAAWAAAPLPAPATS